MSAIAIALQASGDVAQARSTFCVGIIVAATCGASVIYGIERWSLAKQTAVHFAVMVCTVLPALLASGWFPLDDFWGVALVVAVFLGTGAVLWTLFALIGLRTRRPR
ncbi:DUF3021 domain-containing protein [Agromyces archimandritae]|uniref:DUF3021 domain-containing protein n=2 Tax=Agromyces archimandritae TaxID=2781962 RepID=A0A975IQ16_9MICO|nr:DUF3021 domain-containing protein [Agromyces archimandritae]